MTALCPVCRLPQPVAPAGTLARHYSDQHPAFGKRCPGSGGQPGTSDDPCLCLPRPVAVSIRRGGRLLYQCTHCHTTWPLASGHLAHPRDGPTD